MSGESSGPRAGTDRSWRILTVTSSIVSIALTAFFVTYTLTQPDWPKPGHAARAGTRAPSFAALDVSSGRIVRLADLRGQPTLLYFSQGASCRACLLQARELQRASALRARGIRLVVVTTDSAQRLRTAVRSYGITVPALADSSARMSYAYGMVQHGGSVGHVRSDGHAFALIKDGRVAWHDAYPQMDVPTEVVLRDISAIAA